MDKQASATALWGVLGPSLPTPIHQSTPKQRGYSQVAATGDIFHVALPITGKTLALGVKSIKPPTSRAPKRAKRGGKHKRHPFASHRRHACRARIGGGPKRLSQTTDLHSGRISGRRVYGRTCARAGAGEAQDPGAGFHHYKQGRYSMSYREGRRRSR